MEKTKKEEFNQKLKKLNYPVVIKHEDAIIEIKDKKLSDIIIDDLIDCDMISEDMSGYLDEELIERDFGHDYVVYLSYDDLITYFDGSEYGDFLYVG